MMTHTAESPVSAVPSTQPAATTGQVIFSARDLAKVYRSGEVEVHALRDVNLESAEASLLSCSVRRAAASQPCSIFLAASICPAAGKSGLPTMR